MKSALTMLSWCQNTPEKTRLIPQLKTPCDKEICNVKFIVKRKSNVCNNILANKNIQVNHRVNPMQLLYYLALKFVKLGSCPAHEMLIHFCKKKSTFYKANRIRYRIFMSSPMQVYQITLAPVNLRFCTVIGGVCACSWRLIASGK